MNFQPCHEAVSFGGDSTAHKWRELGTDFKLAEISALNRDEISDRRRELDRLQRAGNCYFFRVVGVPTIDRQGPEKALKRQWQNK